MQSENRTDLYIKLSEIASLAENVIYSDDFSELVELSTAHNDLMDEIKGSEPVYSEELVSAIQEADIRVKSAINAIQEKQNQIIKQLTASNKKQLLSRSYEV